MDIKVFYKIVRLKEDEIRKAIIELTSKDKKQQEIFLESFSKLSTSFECVESFYENHPLLQNEFLNKHERYGALTEKQFEALQLNINQISFIYTTVTSMNLLLSVVCDHYETKKYDKLIYSIVETANDIYEVIVDEKEVLSTY